MKEKGRQGRRKKEEESLFVGGKMEDHTYDLAQGKATESECEYV